MKRVNNNNNNNNNDQRFRILLRKRITEIYTTSYDEIQFNKNNTRTIIIQKQLIKK